MHLGVHAKAKLWFDVGIKRYTTNMADVLKEWRLWFDVGIKRYTTGHKYHNKPYSCGLM